MHQGWFLGLTRGSSSDLLSWADGMVLHLVQDTVWSSLFLSSILWASEWLCELFNIPSIDSSST